MSLNSILNIATSGLQASQTQLRVISDNVANVKTPGYVRKIAEQVSVNTNGVGSGVDVGRIRLATDRFLQAASFSAGSEAARQGVRYELYDRIQTLFGDPGGDSGFFSQIDGVFSSFAAMSENATSSPLRQEALFKAQAVFDEAARVSTQIQAVREDADGRIKTAIEKANGLLQQIETLNNDITRATVGGGDASGAETSQAALVSQLAELMDLKVQPRLNGGVSIRTSAGLMLAGQGAATLEYRAAGTVNAETVFNDIYITEPGGQKRSLTDGLKTGELRGLMELRDVEAPATAERLAELVTHVADELNRAHNANSSVPAPNTLNGRNVGQSFATAIAGFGPTPNLKNPDGTAVTEGRTTVAITDAAGRITGKADIVFTAGGMTINGTATSSGAFMADLQTALGGAAVATVGFANGALKIAATNATSGVSIADDPAAPSNKAGRGFSHYFGLNDLVVSDRTSNYDIGLSGTSLHGFTGGEEVSFRFTDASGTRLRDVSVVVPTGGAGTVNELLSALNNPVTGVGRFGAFVLDNATGSVTFKASGSPPAVLNVVSDTTTQVPSGVSVTELFGIGGGVRSSRADGFQIRSDIELDPGKLALAKLDRSAVIGASALSAGDGRGALGLADAGTRTTNFQASGASGGGLQSVSRYASDFSGDIGARSAANKTRAQSAESIATEADNRRSSIEGVNLDEELVAMTTYQQAFNASARMLQAAKDMYDTLLGMM